MTIDLRWLQVAQAHLEAAGLNSLMVTRYTPILAGELCDLADNLVSDIPELEAARTRTGRSKGDDDGVEYADPRDARAERLEGD
jgi:hypothetical protein